MKNLVATMIASMALFACTPRDVLDMPVPDVKNPAEVDKVRKLMFAKVGVPRGVVRLCTRRCSIRHVGRNGE